RYETFSMNLGLKWGAKLADVLTGTSSTGGGSGGFPTGPPPPSPSPMRRAPLTAAVATGPRAVTRYLPEIAQLSAAATTAPSRQDVVAARGVVAALARFDTTAIRRARQSDAAAAAEVA